MIKKKESVVEKIPKVLLEFLIYGTNDKGSKQSKQLIALCNELHNQISKSKINSRKSRILWYSDNEEKTDIEKQNWLKENSSCKYYILIKSDKKTSKNYVKDVLTKIKRLEIAVKSLISDGIVLNKRDKSDIETAKIIKIEKFSK